MTVGHPSLKNTDNPLSTTAAQGWSSHQQDDADLQQSQADGLHPGGAHTAAGAEAVSGDRWVLHGAHCVLMESRRRLLHARRALDNVLVLPVLRVVGRDIVQYPTIVKKAALVLQEHASPAHRQHGQATLQPAAGQEGDSHAA